jgi:hypothetical protein
MPSKFGIIRNSDPIKVNRLFDSHCLLQISEFPKDSLMSSCPDFDLGYIMAVGSTFIAARAGMSVAASATRTRRNAAAAYEALARKYRPDEDPIGQHIRDGNEVGGSSKATRSYYNSCRLLHVRGVNDLVAVPHTHDDSSQMLFVSASIFAAVGEVVTRQIEDDLHTAIGKNAFAFASAGIFGGWQYHNDCTQERRVGLGTFSK